MLGTVGESLRMDGTVIGCGECASRLKVAKCLGLALSSIERTGQACGKVFVSFIGNRARERQTAGGFHL